MEEMELEPVISGKKYLTVLSDGKFHQSVPDGIPNSIVREYADRQGTKHSKTELVYGGVKGLITGITFKDGEYGMSIQISLGDKGIISLSTTSSFGEDFMKKLPNIDIEKPVRLVPYAFSADDKNKKGITVYQGESLNEKVGSYYWDIEKNETTNGIPKPVGDTAKFDKEDWKIYFLTVRKFLVTETQKYTSKVFGEKLPIEIVEEETPDDSALDTIPDAIPF
jgi:hypothetical protein